MAPAISRDAAVVSGGFVYKDRLQRAPALLPQYRGTRGHSYNSLCHQTYVTVYVTRDVLLIHERGQCVSKTLNALELRHLPPIVIHDWRFCICQITQIHNSNNQLKQL